MTSPPVAAPLPEANAGLADKLATLWSRVRRSATIALLFSPIGILLISATRLLVISNYNPSTAAAIASSGGYVETLLGTVIPLVPLLMPYLGIVLLFFKRVIPALLCLFAASLVSPIAITHSQVFRYVRHVQYEIHSKFNPSVVFAAGAIVGLAVLYSFISNNYKIIRAIGTIASVAILPAILILYPIKLNAGVYGRQLNQMWLPTEVFSLPSHRTLIGYKLSSDGIFVEVLTANNRQILFLHESDVLNQQVCQLTPQNLSRPLFTLFSTEFDVPSCRSLIVSHSSAMPGRTAEPWLRLR